MHVTQGQHLYPGSGVNSNQSSGSSLNPNQSSKALVHANCSNHPHWQQKLHSGSTTTSSKQLQISSDNSSQGLVSPAPSGHMLSPSQPAVVASNHHQLQLQSQPQSKKISHTPSNVQRLLLQNRQVHSESSSKSQSDPTQVDQQPSNSASRVNTNSEITQSCMDSASPVPVVTTVSSQWKTSEPPFDSNKSSTQVSSLGSAPVGNSTGNEQSTISQGLGPRSVNLTSNAHNSGAQWQQQQPQPLQQSTSQSIPSKQPYQTPEQHKQQQQEQEQHSPKDLGLQQPSQQHVQHLQSGQSSLLVQPPISKVE